MGRPPLPLWNIRIIPILLDGGEPFTVGVPMDVGTLHDLRQSVGAARKLDPAHLHLYLKKARGGGVYAKHLTGFDPSWTISRQQRVERLAKDNVALMMQGLMQDERSQCYLIVSKEPREDGDRWDDSNGEVDPNMRLLTVRTGSNESGTKLLVPKKATTLAVKLAYSEASIPFAPQMLRLFVADEEHGVPAKQLARYEEDWTIDGEKKFRMLHEPEVVPDGVTEILMVMGMAQEDDIGAAAEPEPEPVHEEAKKGLGQKLKELFHKKK
jgi:hypothetical protein